MVEKSKVEKIIDPNYYIPLALKNKGFEKNSS